MHLKTDKSQIIVKIFSSECEKNVTKIKANKAIKESHNDNL
jgi:hypothetical protein